jgi:hypothetical protein
VHPMNPRGLIVDSRSSWAKFDVTGWFDRLSPGGVTEMLSLRKDI